MPEIMTKTKPKIKIIVAGGRDFNNYELMESILIKAINELELNPDNELIIVSGGAKGADVFAVQFAKEYNIEYEIFHANWEDLKVKPCKIKYNKGNRPYNCLAGFNRNKQMAVIAQYLIAFHDGKSTGTKDMIDLANKHGLSVAVINY
jgi:hypothetical protein